MADLRNVRIHVLGEVGLERRRQDVKWGVQDHPDGTGTDAWLLGGYDQYGRLADIAKTRTDHAAANDALTYADILLEEVFEALAESDPERLRRELVQVAAVAVAWIEAIDRRAVS